MKSRILAMVIPVTAGLVAFAGAPSVPGLRSAARPATRPATQPASRPTSHPATQPVGPGNYTRTLEVDGVQRSYELHVPPSYDPRRPTPVVLVYHGAWASGRVMIPYTGMSNGGMMCHRLAVDLSDRIAAVAPVSGTLCLKDPRPKRPVPVLHFHGTADTLVPFGGPEGFSQRLLNFQSVEETVRTWVRLDGCPEKPVTTKLPDTAKDGTTVTRKVYGPGQGGSEVVLYVIEGGGHSWPGQSIAVQRLGKVTHNISANDLMWEFFEKHPMPPAATSRPATRPATGGDVATAPAASGGRTAP